MNVSGRVLAEEPLLGPLLMRVSPSVPPTSARGRGHREARTPDGSLHQDPKA